MSLLSSMSFLAGIVIVIGGIIIFFCGLLLAYEYWKKLWLITAGEVVSVTEAKNYSEGRRKGYSVAIHYRYIIKNQEYFGEETKVLDVEYHQEKEALKSLFGQFPVGGKIAIFYPRSIPAISSITPGGANTPKIVTWIILTLIYVCALYLYIHARFRAL